MTDIDQVEAERAVVTLRRLGGIYDLVANVWERHIDKNLTTSSASKPSINQEIFELHLLGWSRQEIATRLHLDRETVTRRIHFMENTAQYTEAS